MAAAAITYIDTALSILTFNEPARGFKISEVMMERWPWEEVWFKPSPDQVRNLVKAGALIAAEIDRINRETSKVES